MHTCLSASCIKTSCSCGPFPSLHKASKQSQKPREKGRNSSSKERPLLWKSPPPALREKLMGLFLLPILIEQSNDSEGRGVPLCVGDEFHSCAGVSPWRWHFHVWLLVIGKRQGEKGKPLSYRLTFKLYCLVLSCNTRLLTRQWSLRGRALHLFLSCTLYPWFRIRLLDSSRTLIHTQPWSGKFGG